MLLKNVFLKIIKGNSKSYKILALIITIVMYFFKYRILMFIIFQPIILHRNVRLKYVVAILNLKRTNALFWLNYFLIMLYAYYYMLQTLKNECNVFLLRK